MYRSFSASPSRRFGLAIAASDFVTHHGPATDGRDAFFERRETAGNRLGRSMMIDERRRAAADRRERPDRRRSCERFRACGPDRAATK